MHRRRIACQLVVRDRDWDWYIDDEHISLSFSPSLVALRNCHAGGRTEDTDFVELLRLTVVSDEIAVPPAALFSPWLNK